MVEVETSLVERLVHEPILCLQPPWSWEDSQIHNYIQNDIPPVEKLRSSHHSKPSFSIPCLLIQCLKWVSLHYQLILFLMAHANSQRCNPTCIWLVTTFYYTRFLLALRLLTYLLVFCWTCTFIKCSSSFFAGGFLSSE